jgi:imidazole glycerol-phosphate synthase subunit HisH
MIAIVDVCAGNHRSVERAIAQAGGDVVITRDPDVIRRADKIVVPGQGAFGPFARGLVARDLGPVLREAIASGRPFLGICLGMQVLFEASEEEIEAAGLGAIAGRVQRLRVDEEARVDGAGGGAGDRPGGIDRARLKVPHIGWNQLVFHRPDPMLAGIAEGDYAYFDHSYHAVPVDDSLVVVGADHGIRITAAIRKDNLFACQFHPEKSQRVGLQILSNFVAQ